MIGGVEIIDAGVEIVDVIFNKFILNEWMLRKSKSVNVSLQ